MKNKIDNNNVGSWKFPMVVLLAIISFSTMANFGEGNDLIIKHSDGQNPIQPPIVEKDFQGKNIENLLRKKHKIVLTFDDGPTLGVTDVILDQLKSYGFQATFFIIASKVEKHPELLERIQKEGHIVANHTLNHKRLTDFGWFSWKKSLNQEVFGAHDILSPFMNSHERYYFRAPHGAWESKLAKELNKNSVGKKYIGPILWDVGGELKMASDGSVSQAADWACWANKVTPEDCFLGYKNETLRKDGGVILMHDLSKQSAKLLEHFLNFIKEEKFEVVSMDEVDFQ